MATATAGYSFQAEPRAVNVGRSKYRDPNATLSLRAANIMSDRRVVRGNTYASAIVTRADQILPPSSPHKLPLRPNRTTTHSKSKELIEEKENEYESTMQTQTDDYLEELTDQVFEQDNGTQTEFVEERAMVPVFIPKRAGVDTGTCIEQGELFDFDLSVEPMLQVLVGKSFDQALQEVLEEEEIKKLQRQRHNFQQERNALIAEAQRLEAQTIRHHQEKERRLAQERARLQREQEMAKKVAASTTAKSYVDSLQSSVFSSLQEAGYFYDPIVKQVEKQFMPWLQAKVQEKIGNIDSSRTSVDELIMSAIDKVFFLKSEKERLEREAIEAEERRKREELEAIERAKQEEEERKQKEEEDLLRQQEEEELQQSEEGEGEGDEQEEENADEPVED